MNILYLSHRIPYPPNKGDKIRSYNMIKYLVKLGKVYVAALVDNPDDFQFQAKLEEICEKVVLSPLIPAAKKIKSLLALATGKPLSVPYFYEKKLQIQIDYLIDSCNFDVVICFSSPMAEYVYHSRIFSEKKELGRPILLMDFCDVDSEKWAEYAKRSSFLMSNIYHREWQRLGKYEYEVARKFDHSFFVSLREQNLFQKNHPDVTSVSSISNGVDTLFFKPFPVNANKQEERTEIVFTGAMDYYANVDGVCWFVDKIWPLIKNTILDARFMIVGSNPAKEILKLHDDDNIIVTGFVEDIREYYSRATVCVAPLRIARGIQNKVLEAMAMAKAVVCTGNAFEGINANPNEDLIIADENEDFAAQVIRLVLDKKLRQQIEVNARQCVEQHYNWETSLMKLEQFIHVRHCGLP